MFTRDELQKIANDLNEYLRKNECYEYVYVTYYEDCYQLSADVERGDWKHDHGRINYLVEQFCIENKYDIVSVDVIVTEEDGSDNYSGTHFWVLKELETVEVDPDENVMYTLKLLNDDESLTEDVKLYHSDEDYDFVMFEYIDKTNGLIVDKIKPYTYEIIDPDGESVELVFDPEWPEYVYTIDGKGPQSHSSYEYIASDCYNAINAKTPLEEGMYRQAMIDEINKLGGTNYKFGDKSDRVIFAILQKARAKAAKEANEPDEEFETVEHPTCDNCGMRLNDGGTCPRCDDGEEDLNESIDNTLQKDAEKILKHACDKPEMLLQYPTFEDYIDELSIASVFTIPESVPSVGFKVVDAENISETEAAEYIKLLLDKTWLRERLEELADSLVHNNGFRYDMLKDEFKVGDRVAHRYADEYNVGTIKDTREHEGIQYQVEWDYSEGEPVEWLHGDELTHWVDAK